MKYSKLLKSAILSTALLSMGAAQAQQTGETKLTIVNLPLTITASEMNFGSYTRSDATAVVTLTCGSSGAATSSASPSGIFFAAGTCGAVTVSTTSSTAVGFTASVTATALTSSGATDLAAPTLVMYESGGSTLASTTRNGVDSAGSFNLWIGGVVNLGASQATGEYSGNYTFTATIQ